MSTARPLSLGLVLAITTGLACSTGADDPGFARGGDRNSAAGESGQLGSSSSGSAGASDGSQEICDGIDNDGDGNIDNVDVGNDGICDCLNVATIGRLGIWSDGTGIFADWLRRRTPKGAVAIGDREITRELLQPFQVIILLNVARVASSEDTTENVSHAYTAAESAALADWVKAGGGLVTTIGYVADSPAIEIPNANALLRSLDMAYNVDPPGWTLAGDLDITDWSPHPLTQGVTAAHVQNGIRPVQSSGVTTIGWAAGKRPVLAVKEAGAGRVAMWADEWITYDSDWESSTSWQIERLWLNLFKWLSPPKTCQVPIPALK
jgi:hypothetical protein